ncbi:PilZ domain-containing protein [Cohaesibacter sp. ES.047]|nr:PilZ domain-containing protein [Cohaesibacter sp. ES.047]
MLENKQEYPCQVINMSPGGVALIAPIRGEIGERVIAYIDHIGRIEGKIVRKIEGGFALTVDATSRKRDKLASQLTWLANRHILDLPEDRRHERQQPKAPITKLILEDGTEHICQVLDLSLSGAAVKTKVRPKIGKPVKVGKIRARVVRHLEDGLAIEFAAVQDRNMLDENLR